MTSNHPECRPDNRERELTILRRVVNDPIGALASVRVDTWVQYLAAHGWQRGSDRIWRKPGAVYTLPETSFHKMSVDDLARVAVGEGRPSTQVLVELLETAYVPPTTPMPKPDECWRHYKGGLGTIVCVAKRECDHAMEVVYREGAEIYTRLLGEFVEHVERPGYSGPRFVRTDLFAKPAPDAQGPRDLMVAIHGLSDALAAFDRQDEDGHGGDPTEALEVHLDNTREELRVTLARHGHTTSATKVIRLAIAIEDILAAFDRIPAPAEGIVVRLRSDLQILEQQLRTELDIFDHPVEGHP